MTTANSIGANSTRLVRVAKLFNGIALLLLAVGWVIPVLAVTIHFLVLLANNFGYGGDLIFASWSAAEPPVVAFLICFPMYYFFKRLGKIIKSVLDRDVLSIENADNLKAMGWYLFVSQIAITLAVAWNFTLIDWADDDAIWNNSIELALTFPYYLMVVVLFILAGVFRHGAEMREDLEGTV